MSTYPPTSMQSLPSAVVAHLANAFLDDRDAVAWATSNRALFSDLRSTYRIKQRLALRVAVTFLPLSAASPIGVHRAPDTRWCVGTPVDVDLNKDDSPCLARLHGLTTVRTLTGGQGVSVPPDQSRPIALPPSLRSLEIDDSTGGLVLSALLLPASLQWIYLPSPDFASQGLDRVVWPSQLTSLINIGSDSISGNTPIESWARLPAGLRACHFGHQFNQPLPNGWLPQSLVEITFGGAFDQPLSGLVFPPRLERLHLLNNRRYSHALDLSQLPVSCIELALPACGDQPDNKHKYAQLRLPMHVRRLKLFHADKSQSSADLVLPSSMTDLIIWPNVSLGSIRWPPKLGPLTLRLPQLRQPVLSGHIPPSTTELELISWDGAPDELVLPGGLTSLALDPKCFARIQEFKLPASLTRLNGRPYEVAAASQPIRHN